MIKPFYILPIGTAAGLIWIAFQYPFAFDDAFISYRITENLIAFGRPYFNFQDSVNTSTSLIYPFWNSIWALLFKENWTEKIPIINAVLLGFSFWMLTNRISQWFPKSSNLFIGIGAASMIPIWLDFRNILYGNSGLETCLYMAILSVVAIPGPKMAIRYSIFSWWLILIRPEGPLAGVARLISAWVLSPTKSGWRTSLFWAFGAFLVWFISGLLLFENVVPQSIVAKSFHHIDRLMEIKKGLSYLLFVNNPIELGLFLAGFILVPDLRKASLGPILWLILYLLFYSTIAAWWPWYVPPMFLVFAFLTGISSIGLLEYLFKKINKPTFRLLTYGLCIGLVSAAIWHNSRQTLENLKEASVAFKQRKEASETIGKFITKTFSTEKTILIEPVGLIGWYSPLHHFLDYPGLTNEKMSSFLEKKKRKIPHRLTDSKTDSSILHHFEPDVLVLWREEKVEFDKLMEFQLFYLEREKLPYFPGDQRMDSVWIYEKLFFQPLY